VLRAEGTDDQPALRRAGYLIVPLCLVSGLAGFLAAGAIAQPSAVSGCLATGRTIALCPTKLGGVLVNSKGHTLYSFNKDQRGKSTCYRSCASFWPPLLAHGKPKLGPGVKKSLLGTTRRSDGTRQLTYNKHPLYTFKLDRGAGQTNGEGLKAFGAKWYAVSPRGTAVKPRPGATTTAATSTNGCTSPPCY
jgi:predicted lipoprotein with Yx(FWY)xxD motif